MKHAMNKKSNGVMRGIETAIDASVPYLLVILLIITSIDIFYAEMAHTYSNEIVLIDNAVIWLFIIDLLFKYHNAKNAPRFIKENWLGIFAVMPFYFIFRFVDEFVIASELVKEGQQTLHIAEGVEKEAATAVKDIKGAKIITRSERMLRELRVLSRIPRFAKAARLIPHFAKAVRFFENPKHVRNS